ncbi:MAG: hypothetical protein ACI883_000722 [Candidatus Azotimanducaceae bacterium]
MKIPAGFRNLKSTKGILFLKNLNFIRSVIFAKVALFFALIPLLALQNSLAQGIVWGGGQGNKRVPQILNTSSKICSRNSIANGARIGAADANLISTDCQNDILANFVYIRGGCDDEGCIADFKISAYEVTNKQFREFQKDYSTEALANTSLNGEFQPVLGVSAGKAGAYADWLSAKTRQKFRLPTKREWLHSIKSVDFSEGAFCKYAHSNRGSALAATVGNYEVCPRPIAGTLAVGSKLASNNGIYDLFGNAAEMVCDGTYETCTSGKAQAIAYVAVGGSWLEPLEKFNVESIYRIGPSGSPSVGFRLLQEL